jgi:hypothetical protein
VKAALFFVLGGLIALLVAGARPSADLDRATADLDKGVPLSHDGPDHASADADDD